MERRSWRILHVGVGALSLMTAGLSTSCRSAGDVRLLGYEPDPVPLEARSGWAWFRVHIASLAREAVQLGRGGPWLPGGASTWLDADLPPGTDTWSLEILDARGRRVTVLACRVASRTTAVADEAVLPLPELDGRQGRVVAGFHAANHRHVGRRLAVDIAAQPPHPTLDAVVTSPVAGTVLALTDDAPDEPSERANEIFIRADDGKTYLYAHFRRASIPWRPGKRVEIGAVLGRVGLSGRTSGPHLHVEVLPGT